MTAPHTVAGHTAGPWAVAAGAPEYIGSGSKWVACTMGVRGTPEAEANARLIAAAPDLLTALRDCETYFANLSGMTVDDAQDALDTVRAAIAKATAARQSGEDATSLDPSTHSQLPRE